MIGHRSKSAHKGRANLKRRQGNISFGIPITSILSKSNDNLGDNWSIMSNLSITGDDRHTEQDSNQSTKSPIEDFFLNLLIKETTSADTVSKKKLTDARDDSNSNDIIKKGLSQSLSDEYHPITKTESYSIIRPREDDDSCSDSIYIKESPSFIEYSSSSQSGSANGWTVDKRSEINSHEVDKTSVHLTLSTLLFEHIKNKSWSEVFQRIQSHPEETNIWVNGESSDSSWKYLPIHLACISCCPKEVIRQLIEINPNSALLVDFRGRLPIHIACQRPCVPVDIVQLLLQAYPESIHVKDNFGLLPVHIALASGFHEAKNMLANSENIHLRGDDKTKGRLSEFIKKRKWKHR